MPIQEPVLVAIQPDGAKPPIFGIHVLGVNMRFYRPLAERLGSDQPLFGLWTAGATAGLADPTDAVAVATGYADELERAHPSGPITLAAVSLGSVVAFELAQQLLARDRQVALLAFFDAVGPDIDQSAPSVAETSSVHLAEFSKGAAGYVEGRLRKTRARAKRRIEMADLKARRTAGMPVDDKLQRREFIEANFALQKAYDYRPFPGRMVAFKAGDDAFTQWQAEQGMGWSSVVTGGLDVVVVPGGHLSMLDEPNVERLAAELASTQAAAIAALDS